MTEQKVNINIVDGDSFYCHELSINFNPGQFTLDFKNISPRVDQRNDAGPTIVIKHNVVITDPYHTKKIYELLGKMLDRYEKEFGKIQEPAAYKKAKKKQNVKKIVTDTPGYFG